MTTEIALNNPWLVAVWPGMGHVAMGAGYYLMAKLGMYQCAEFSTEGLFDIDAVFVNNGLIETPYRPRSRLFAWKAPEGKRDIIVFIGEAQPPLGKYAFCKQLIDFSREQGVARVFTFAAMVTEMSPGDEARVFMAATQQSLLDELRNDKIDLLQSGHVGGLNGVLLAAAAENEIPGVCLLGEMPHLFAQMIYPKASLAVLRAFLEMANIDLDLAELAKHAETTEHRLGELVAEMRRQLRGNAAAAFTEETGEATTDQESDLTGDEWKTVGKITAEDEARIESMFEAAQSDRSRAFALKNELDRLGVFTDYEDRFLDIFKKE